MQSTNSQIFSLKITLTWYERLKNVFANLKTMKYINVSTHKHIHKVFIIITKNDRGTGWIHNMLANKSQKWQQI